MSSGQTPIYDRVIERIKKDYPSFFDGGLFDQDFYWVPWYEIATDEELEEIREERERLGLGDL